MTREAQRNNAATNEQQRGTHMFFISFEFGKKRINVLTKDQVHKLCAYNAKNGNATGEYVKHSKLTGGREIFEPGEIVSIIAAKRIGGVDFLYVCAGNHYAAVAAECIRYINC